MQHFYDKQIRRYLTQMIRMFSGFSYADGKGALVTVPVSYGDLTRQVANIIRDNSENKMPSAPLGRRQKKNSTTSIVTSLFKLSGLSDMKLHFLRPTGGAWELVL